MQSLKKTKIVCTIGPATESKEQLTELLKAGMNVMRLNFSHGDFAEHQNRVNNFREALTELGMSGAIMQDLAGPKIRIGNFSTESIDLKEGQTFTITTDDIVGDETKVSVNYPMLPEETKPGHVIYLHDGKKKLEVVEVSGSNVICKVLVGGPIKGRRGVNLPDADLSISSLTDKDKTDLEFGIQNNVDFFALSFVRRPSDITELRDILTERGSKAGIIAKIETPQAVANIDEIIDLVDGIMVARGDLAIEVPAEKVPLIQKNIIKKSNDAGKPVITATQMLESMIHSPVPTRAEVSDIANAILDGSDAVMLSEETTLGEFPIDAVSVMSRVAHEVEMEFPPTHKLHNRRNGETDYVDSLTGAVVHTAHEIGAMAIFALTETGFTPRMISRYKPGTLLIALSNHEETARKLTLSYACYPMVVERITTLEGMVMAVKKTCAEQKIGDRGDKIVVSAGAPFSATQKANMMMIVEL